MVSDVLSDAVSALDDYLKLTGPGQPYHDWYGDAPTLQRILAVREHMDRVRYYLNNNGSDEGYQVKPIPRKAPIRRKA